MLDDHQELKLFIKVLPTAEELETLKKKIFESIKEFNDKNMAFKKLFEDNCDYILRFDEIITQKASKITVEDAILELKKKYDVEFLKVNSQM